MRFLLSSYIENARESLHSNRLRTGLTILGVTIGVASITAILSLGAGASHVVQKQVDSLGNNIAVIRPVSTDKTGLNFSKLQPTITTSSLSETDYKTIKNTPHIEAAAPISVLASSLTGSDKPVNAQIVATTPDLAAISALPLSDGEFISDQTVANTAVLGNQLSIDLFGTDQSLGKTFQTHNTTFTVIGILKPLNNPINYNSVDFDSAAIIHLDTAKSMANGVLQIQQIDARADSVANLDRATITINKQLLRAHQGQADFATLTGSAISQPTSQLFSIITGVTTVVATISLLIGGIGIMNIMLVTVAERTREIGIRKALGASNGDIVWQFLIESLIISLLGGVSGYLIGYATAFLISSFLPFLPTFSWQIAALTLAISISLGTLFGLYPSVRAARKNPIDSLRQYS